MESETEWAMNKKIIDLQEKDVRHAIPNGLTYFMVEFEINKGYAHVIEDEHMFPKNFAEVIFFFPEEIYQILSIAKQIYMI